MHSQTNIKFSGQLIGHIFRGQEFKSPEMSVRKYHHSLRNYPEELSSQLLSGGSLISRIEHLYGRILYVTSRDSKELLDS